MNRIVRATLVAGIALGLALQGAAPVSAAAPMRVTIIVGPVGENTARFRAQAEEAAAVAERAGAQVIRVYSPDATWAAVKRAVTGASIVVYLGHGNGWPSPYRDALYPPTQNGFGLNPVAGVDDEAHQYFGEKYVGALRLAPNAVVLLHHLCYASGNSEPGLAEGTQEDAIQRVDNFAAGFIRAGARAVVAEGHLGPAYYVRELLRGSATIERIWSRSPNRHGNTFAVESVRSPGFVARLDPTRADGGYYRSLVTRGALRATDVRAGASGSVIDVGPPPEPTLTDLGLRFGTPALAARPVAAGTSSLTLPLSPEALARIPSGVEVGVRWDPILSQDGAAPEPTAPAASPAPSATPVPSSDPREPGPADSDPTPGPEAPEVSFVVPEQQGSLVRTSTGVHGPDGLIVDVEYPSLPGLYRLVATLYQPGGEGYDAATQALLTPLLVRVAGETGVAWGIPTGVTTTPGAALTVPVRVVNTGSDAWDSPIGGNSGWRGRDPARLPARLVATWVSTTGAEVPQPVSFALRAEASAPGGEAVVGVTVTAPVAPGAYLLVLDIATPDRGPLSALGADPGILRVEVIAP